MSSPIKDKDYNKDNPPEIQIPDLDNDKFIYELLLKKYNDILNQIENLDSKANNMIGYISIILGITGIGSISLFNNFLNVQFYLFYILGISILFFSLLFSLYGFKIRDWHIITSERQHIIDFLALRDYQITLSKIIGILIEANNYNQKQNNVKANRINKSWWLLLFGIIIIIISIILNSFNESTQTSSIEINYNIYR